MIENHILKAIGDTKPSLGIILGSGSTNIANKIKPIATFPYADLPGFMITTVKGHPGQLIIGEFAGKTIACLQGRPHYYEGASNEVFLTIVRCLRLIGCETLLITNAAGSIHPDWHPGELMVITDHINMMGKNPLVGANAAEFGVRFPDMIDAYTPKIITKLQQIATKHNIKCHQGRYVGILGPSLETPAEIHAFSLLGAHAVGMSTIPEVIVARHCGMQIGAISILTNMAAGLAEVAITHEQVLATAAKAEVDLALLLVEFVSEYQ